MNKIATVVKIDKPTYISDIKRIFNMHFPYLKIEFFKEKNIVNQNVIKKTTIPDDFIINIDKKTSITYYEEMLVSELENLFFEKFKMKVRILRMSGKTWLETAFTYNWSLKKQNQQGYEINKL